MRHPFKVLLLLLYTGQVFAQQSAHLQLAKTIYGNITPKSITHDGNGRFYAQNMMYSHNITVYDRHHKLVSTIKDKINLASFGFDGYEGEYSGAPVEAATSDCGKYLWVTNYQMFGEGFDNPGSDDCKISKDYDSSFVYKINTQTHLIESVVQVGCVPKYIAVTPDNKYVLVSNWCSGDLSIIGARDCKEMKRLDMGRYPRGIVVDSKSRYAYVAIMGSTEIIRVDLGDFTTAKLGYAGKRPRHLCIDSKDKFLYATLNAESKVVKIDLNAFSVIDSAVTESAPRSMAISPDNSFLYITNYSSNSLSVISTDSMKAVQTVPTGTHPIGVTYDAVTNNVWVACYSGCIQVFKNVPAMELAVEKPAEKQKQLAATDTIKYHIVVGAFREEQNVKKMMKKCTRAGYVPYVINPDGNVKKISCMGFASKESAMAELTKVKTVLTEGAWICRQ